MTISLHESYTQIRDLWERAVAARRSRDRDAALDALRSLQHHPCAHHQVAHDDLFDEMHQVLRELGRFDEAIESRRAAIAAGFRSEPDPEADIAECLLAAGRRAEADELYAALRARDPDDVWLYNSAGFAYRDVDDREALHWLLAGIDMAIATGDRDMVVDQLLDLTREQWARLGEAPDDELVARATDFVANWTRPPIAAPRWADAQPQPEPERCLHCGFDPDHPPPLLAHSARSSSAGESIGWVMAWFPDDEWTLAVERWPDLLDGMPADHRKYSHRIEARIKQMKQHLPGTRVLIGPLSVAELIESEGDAAGSPEGRSRRAAELARTGRTIAGRPVATSLAGAAQAQSTSGAAGRCRRPNLPPDRQHARHPLDMADAPGGQSAVSPACWVRSIPSAMALMRSRRAVRFT